jgi:hypothetical protein
MELENWTFAISMHVLKIKTLDHDRWSSLSFTPHPANATG